MVKWNLPNLVTAGRLVLTPLLFVLLLQPRMSMRFLGFVVFAVAALSDLWDGYLARRRGQVTDFGRLADPLADKLLLAAALVPFYMVTTAEPSVAGLPVYGVVSLWVVLVLLGREVVVTVLRTLAARRGEVVAASRAGKYKAFTQNLFNGAMVLWLALRTGATERGWSGEFWEAWQGFHGWFIAATLTVALLLTVYSLVLYLRQFWEVLRGGDAGGDGG